MDTARLLAHGCIEVDASHWNRYAFLVWPHSLDCPRFLTGPQRRCLHIFLIGIGNYKTIPLKDIYSPSLLPSLHRDLRIKVGDTLGIDVELDDFDPGPMVRVHANQVHENSTDSLGDVEGNTNDTEAGDNGTGLNINHDGDDNENRPDDTETGMAETNELHPDDLGFGGNGKCAVFTSTKFWRFVDASLEGIRKMAKVQAEELDDGTTVENIIRNVLVEYFQQDLAEFPGKRTVPKLLSTTSPQWQTTSQTNLLW
ncbi:uncharacterized protein EDB91DRAFT_1052264 [Suillus paluster]|uniref:uncharacterized protein n=1 Tax=Suillus paluster TaxID=48578 RepID=UPI001B85D644|nr:uncharacterized protein EDB91DRAFT_1052264 [Suillus paluster]KAG1741909.1 hypothetical protein EDB91DRAFT_1052264 [Suillus paluster]